MSDPNRLLRRSPLASDGSDPLVMDKIHDKENVECTSMKQPNYIAKYLDEGREDDDVALYVCQSTSEKSIRKSPSFCILTNSETSFLDELNDLSPSDSEKDQCYLDGSLKAELCLHMSPLKSSVFLAYLASQSLPETSSPQSSKREDLYSNLERQFDDVDEMYRPHRKPFLSLQHNIHWEENKPATLKCKLLARLLDVTAEDNAIPIRGHSESGHKTSQPLSFTDCNHSEQKLVASVPSASEGGGVSKYRRPHLRDIDRDLNATAPSSF